MVPKKDYEDYTKHVNEELSDRKYTPFILLINYLEIIL